MLKKLIIRPFFGELPEWMPEYYKNIEDLKKYGFDFLIFTDKQKFIDLVKEKLGIELDFSDYEKGDTRKVSELRPAFGIIFEDYLKDYDFWGHTDFDVVYGNLSKFVSDEFLNGLDIFGNDPEALCGPFSLFRNISKVNNLFKEEENWAEIFKDKIYHAFDEEGMSEVVKKARDEGRIRAEFRFWQAGKYQRVIKVKENLYADSEETMMFHFRNANKYPNL